MVAVLKRAAKEGLNNRHLGNDLYARFQCLFPGSAREVDEIAEGLVLGQNTIYQLFLLHHPRWGSSEGAYGDSPGEEGDCGPPKAPVQGLLTWLLDKLCPPCTPCHSVGIQATAL
ncbi:hypothetical protein M9458_015166 [Cirrhinus mrigala]|uniref:Uncharacterized protein n=1 Tax=Cirrhinus mrigala TaxID=683832 RepID=A0ABD0QQD3_CIRMR